MSTELAKTGGALAIRPDQTTWTPEQAAVLRQSGIGESVTRAELDGFLHLCQRTGLDPFSRQIYLIGRWDKRANREVYTPQTGIDGYRVVARRATAKSGGSYGYEDTLWCDESGKWRDVWLTDKPPAAAKVIVIRDGQRFSAVARYSEYVQTNRDGKPIGLWAKMPAGQLAKCTEALALRKAFPHDLAGVYTAEEMAQADNPAPERHLRSVTPGEPDQWATPAAVVQAATAAVPTESLTPAGRDYLHEAHAAPDAATVRKIWQDARTEGAMPEYLAQIAQVGKEKAAAEQQPAAVTDDEPVDVETVDAPEPDEHDTAEAELRALASQLGIDDIDRDAHGALGAPIADASTQAIRGLTAQLRGAA
ncbi:phage recombination protein Bet [Streptomyces sp. NPDC054933]